MSLIATLTKYGTTNYILVNYLLARNVLSIVQKKSTNIDAIDSFTNELIEQKALKWEVIRKGISKVLPDKECQKYNNVVIKQSLKKSAQQLIDEINNLYEPKLCVDIRNFNQRQVDNLIVNSIESDNENDLVFLIDQCYKWKKVPSDITIYLVLNHLSSHGKRNCIKQMANLCIELRPEFYKENQNFLLYEAICMWFDGNSVKALNMMQTMYMESSTEQMRGEVMKTFQSIIKETIGCKSEAILITLTKIAENLHKNFNERNFLETLWTECFTSEWFSDQQNAVQLFEKHDYIRNSISTRVNFLCFHFLRDHKTEAVYRLIELLLKFNMALECKKVLSLLFDYQYWRKDLRACSEIIQTCLDLGIPLSEAYDKKLLNLLLRPRQILMKKEIKPPSYEYKF